jgi:predicted dehydrogenase
MEVRGGECHSGSHSPFSRSWKHAGGGALARLAVHGIGATLYLKRCEGLERDGESIRVASVESEVANLMDIPSVQAEEHKWLRTGWVDVENWARVSLSFEDGSRATIFGSDAVLGGMQSYLEIYMSNAVLHCKMTLNDQVECYAPDPSIFQDEYLVEKLETKAGWNRPAPDEELTLGHHEQAQDFVEAVAEGRPALGDATLGLDVVEVVYSAYLSAEQGKKIVLDDVRPSYLKS